MTYMSVTADQMSSAAGYLVRNWGDYGYRFEAVETRTHAVSGGEYKSIDSKQWR